MGIDAAAATISPLDRPMPAPQLHNVPEAGTMLEPPAAGPRLMDLVTWFMCCGIPDWAVQHAPDLVKFHYINGTKILTMEVYVYIYIYMNASGFSASVQILHGGKWHDVCTSSLLGCPHSTFNLLIRRAWFTCCLSCRRATCVVGVAGRIRMMNA
jgi:hypothetical protein